MEGALPYRIPGPAGGLSTQVQTPNASPQRPVLDLFRTPPWRQMLAHLNRKIPSSIALLRRNALSNEYAKLSMLPVLIDSLIYVGKDASVLLRDPTGHVRGTIHADVFLERKGKLERGVVLLLNGISALAYLEETRGFRKGDDAVHLSVQACHVSEVFKGDALMHVAPPSHSLLDDYELQARSPKPVVKPPRVRLPLRDRNYSGPISRGFRSSPQRGGTVGGRGQLPRACQQQKPYSQHRMQQQHPRRSNQNFQRPQNSHEQSGRKHLSRQRNFGSNEHKRPFCPPATRSNAAGYDILPPQKRPNVRHVHQVNVQHRQQPHSVEAITDEQLDSLLGDLDVDAMIAAHGKSTSLAEHGGLPQVQRTTIADNKFTTKPPTAGGLQQDEFVASSGVVQGVNAGPSTSTTCISGDSLERVQATAIDNDTSSAEAIAVAVPQSAGTLPQMPDSAPLAAPNALEPKAEHRTISDVNQDMVNNLFDGIDAAEFM